jgi:membrane-associated phospholipid phosphatase
MSILATFFTSPWFWLLAVAIGHAFYVPLNRQVPKYYWRLPIDDRIPFLPQFYWLYVTYFLFLPGAILLLWQTQHSLSLLMSLTLATFTASLFWWVWPNGVKRPSFIPKNFTERWLQTIHQHDGDCNGLPSSHVFSACICGWFLATVYPQFAVVIWLITGGITISTVLVKQHYISDAIAGIIWAIGAVSLVQAAIPSVV